MDSHLRIQSGSSRVSGAEQQEGASSSNGTRVESVLSTRTAGMTSDSNQASTSGDIPSRVGNRTRFSVVGLSDNDEIPFQCQNIYQGINSETNLDLSDYIHLPDVANYSKLKSQHSFLSIQSQFLSDINKLKALTKFFLLENFDEKIATFYDNIQTEYGGNKQDMFKLYKETRLHLRCLLVHLDLYKDDDPRNSNRKDYVASILDKCLEGIELCSAGVYARFYSNFLDTEALKQGLESKLLEIRKGLFEQCITSFMTENQRNRTSFINKDMEIHWFNTLHNLFCQSLNIPSFDDVYANTKMEKELIKKFKLLKNLVISPSAILQKLVDEWSNNMSSALKNNGVSEWETEVMNDSAFSAEIMESLDNKIFQPINYYMGKITSGALSFSFLLDDKGNNDYSLSRHKEKLSLWVAKNLDVSHNNHSSQLATSFFAHSRVRLWHWVKNKVGMSRNNHSSEPVVTVFATIPGIQNQILCIGSMNRLVFWVFKPEKNPKKGQECTFDTDNHITLELSHLSSIKFSKESDEVTYAIMTQALAQTNSPEDIASFFLHQSMDNLAKRTDWIIKKLSAQLANKLIYNGSDFRTSLCECICSKVLASNTSNVSKETLGWLIDTPLLEPVLLHLNKEGIDTTPIAQSLNSWEMHSFSEEGINRLFTIEKLCHLFQQACSLNQREIALRLLLTENCDSVANCGTDPLIFFASNCIPSGVKYLLEKFNVDINMEDEYGNTPLICAAKIPLASTLAAQRDQIETLKLLLGTSGVLLNKKNADGVAAIHWAIIEITGFECLKVLLDENELDVNLTMETSGNTPLHIAVYQSRTKRVHALLKVNRIKANEKNNNGYTPLYIAMIGKRNEEIIKALVATEAVDVNMVFHDGNMPLHLALVNNESMYFNELLKRKDIDINKQNADGYTPLHIAIAINDTDSVDKLLESDSIDLTKKDNNNFTPMALAIKKHAEELVNKLLLKLHALDINTEDCAPLHLAIEEGDGEFFRRLLKIDGIDINKKLQGYTALHLAASKACSPCLIPLLEARGLDKNVKSASGFTALHLATQAGKHNENIKTLLKNPLALQVNLKDTSGRMPLHYVAFHGDIESLNELLTVPGIQVFATDNRGFTPLQYAKMAGHTDCFMTLLAFMTKESSEQMLNYDTHL